MIDATLLDPLGRIEAQNLEILSLLGAARKPKRFLPADEVAERLDRSPWTIRQLCNAGQIRGIKGDDGCWRIPADEVDRLENEGVPRLPRR